MIEFVVVANRPDATPFSRLLGADWKRAADVPESACWLESIGIGQYTGAVMNKSLTYRL